MLKAEIGRGKNGSKNEKSEEDEKRMFRFYKVRSSYANSLYVIFSDTVSTDHILFFYG